MSKTILFFLLVLKNMIGWRIMYWKSFLFLLLCLGLEVVVMTMHANNPSSSSSNNNNNNNNNNNPKHNNRKRFVIRRGTKWEHFVAWLEHHKEFTKSWVMRELCDGHGFTPATVEKYLYLAKEAGMVSIRVKKRTGGRWVIIYTSNVYRGGGGGA